MRGACAEYLDVPRVEASSCDRRAMESLWRDRRLGLNVECDRAPSVGLTVVIHAFTAQQRENIHANGAFVVAVLLLHNALQFAVRVCERDDGVSGLFFRRKSKLQL